MTKRKISILLTSAALLQLAAGCFGGGGNQQPIELTVWKPFEEQEALSPIFESYRKLHPNVNFHYVKKDVATYENELVNALASGTGPDIFSIHNDWLPQYYLMIQL